MITIFGYESIVADAYDTRGDYLAPAYEIFIASALYYWPRSFHGATIDVKFTHDISRRFTHRATGFIARE